MNNFFLAIVLRLAGFYNKAFAQATVIPPQSFTITNPLACNPGNDLTCALIKIAAFLLYLAAPIATIMVLVGAFMMITAAGNPEKFSQGKKTLLYAAIGFVVILAANAVAPLIQSLFK